MIGRMINCTFYRNTQDVYYALSTVILGKTTFLNCLYYKATPWHFVISASNWYNEVFVTNCRFNQTGTNRFYDSAVGDHHEIDSQTLSSVEEPFVSQHVDLNYESWDLRVKQNYIDYDKIVNPIDGKIIGATGPSSDGVILTDELEESFKYLSQIRAWNIDEWVDKEGDVGTYQIKDPNDSSHTVMEVIPSSTSPYRIVHFMDSPSFANPSNEDNLTLENINKYISQIGIWLTGKWTDKAEEPGTYQILDPDDWGTVKMEVKTSDISPYKIVKIFE
jgi:hypothetical protein